MKALIGTLYSTFYCLGSIASNYLSDKYGRRNVIVISVFMVILMDVGSAFASSLEVFLVLYIGQSKCWLLFFCKISCFLYHHFVSGVELHLCFAA